MCTAEGASGVPLPFAGRSNLSVLINNCCRVVKQLPHSYLSLIKKVVRVWFTSN